jgi:hypothetical protein
MHLGERALHGARYMGAGVGSLPGGGGGWPPELVVALKTDFVSAIMARRRLPPPLRRLATNSFPEMSRYNESMTWCREILVRYNSLFPAIICE